MPAYLLKRAGQSLLTVFLTVSAVFVLLRLAPGDPAAAFAPPNATAPELEAVRRQLGLDQPLPQQYLSFLRDLVTGDLGTSYSFHLPALRVVLEAVPNTVLLALTAMLLAAVVSIPLGAWMAKHADSGREILVDGVTIAAQSMPDFWTGIMLLSAFAVAIPLFPAGGFGSWSALVLPAVTIGILQIALLSRMVRREMTGVLAAPYITAARSRGISGTALTWGYGMRNSAVPVVTAMGTRFAAMLNGVVVVEVVFGWPGVGQLVVRALDTRDYPLIQATVLVTSVLTVAVQLLVDLVYPLLDPRVRLGRRPAT